ncbi:MAG TPA: hypothetical protein ENH87_12650 [Pricia antarctica]|uniref:Uncharacterized protein n=2 Tax=root TaxID=1 RepID=A0A831VNI2_9FLAO|nr:hypothetical protein [Pricia antarctica]
MKTIIYILILVAVSCQPQELFVNYDNFEINIPGTPGPWIKYHDKYFCYFRTDNDQFNSASNHQFYIIAENGEINTKVDVPQAIQKNYYDLYIKNDTLFTTEYYNHNTFYLDLSTNTWIETRKGIDLYFADKDYSVYSLDFGEWGGSTWFEDRQTKNQYEIGVSTPIVNRLNETYYLTSGTSILKIDNPKRLDKSEEPYDYKKAVLDKDYHKESNYSTNGAETVFEYSDNDYFNPTFSIATSFIQDNKLYHLYKDSISTKIGRIENNDLIPIYTLKSNIRPFIRYYDTRNPIQNKNSQTLQFKTNQENVYGLIVINENDINIITFDNKYKEPVYGKNELNEWVEKSLEFFSSNLDNLHISEIDSLEKKIKATDVTQKHKISTYRLEGMDVETPRIYRKIESDTLKLITMYYYGTIEKEIELIHLEWVLNNKNTSLYESLRSTIKKDKKANPFEPKFICISNYLTAKFGKPSSIKKESNGFEQKWIADKLIIVLDYSGNVQLTIQHK